MRADGSRLRRLAGFTSNAKRGDVSPDGRLVLFDGGPQLGGSQGDFDVQVMGIDGNGRRTVAGTPSREIDARFSPDGRWISYTEESLKRATASIWIATLQGTERRRLTSGFSARWSPDGRRLFFARGAGLETDLYTMSVDGGRVSRLTRTPGTETPAAWSPDGRLLLFTRQGVRSGIYVMNPDGRHVRRLASGDDAVAGAWSPDGRWIAFAKHHRIFAMHTDGTGARQVLRNRLDVAEVTSWVRAVG
jgi:Tol biopolymer transport system component